MSNSSIFNNAFNENVVEFINESLTEAIEPIIQDSIKKAERTIREKAAATLISYIRNQVDVYMDRNEIRVVFGELPKK